MGKNEFLTPKAPMVLPNVPEAMLRRERFQVPLHEQVPPGIRWRFSAKSWPESSKDTSKNLNTLSWITWSIATGSVASPPPSFTTSTSTIVTMSTWTRRHHSLSLLFFFFLFQVKENVVVPLKSFFFFFFNLYRFFLFSFNSEINNNKKGKMASFEYP